MDDFYLVLSSSVKDVAGGINEGGHFYTYLPQPLQLDKTKWKVALVDMSYMVSWFNVTSDNCLIRAKKRNGQNCVGYIGVNYYSNITDLIAAINRLLGSFGLVSKLLFLSRELHFHLIQGESVEVHPTISNMLGFTMNKFVIHKRSLIKPGDRGVPYNSFQATHVPSLQLLPVQNLYVYTNIIDSIIVGDTYAPLLQVVPVTSSEHGSVNHLQMSSPLYMHLSSDDISVIEIKLCDQEGKIIAFAFGEVVLKLHFRKVVTQ